MGKVKRVLQWIAVIFLCFLELLYILSILTGQGEGVFLPMVICAVPAFFIIRSLRSGSPAASRSAEPRRRSGPSLVTFRALPSAEILTVQDYVVLDVETTGLHPETDEIIEVAAIRSIAGNLDGFTTLVFPRHRIPAEVTQLTGIRNVDVLNAPQIKDVAPKLLDFIRGYPVVAHNAPFDVKFLAAAFDTIGADIDIRYIDTVPLARAAFPGMPNYKLETLIRELELLDGEQEHRAGSDTEATLKLFELCRKEIPVQAEKAEREQRQAAIEEKAYHLNQYGTEAEAAGNVGRAISYYEDVIADGAVLPNAYMRLAVIYKKQHRWEDVVRVCDAALAVLPGHAGKWCQPEEWEKRKAYAVTKLGTKTAAPSDG